MSARGFHPALIEALANDQARATGERRVADSVWAGCRRERCRPEMLAANGRLGQPCGGGCQHRVPRLGTPGAFSVFRLADAPTRERAPARPAALALGDCAQQRLLALADAFNVDGRQLVEEFQDHQRVAQGIKNTRPEVSSVEAWREALAKTQRTPRSQETWPARALLPVAERYFVCPGSTAGIEQTFSVFKRMTGEQWHASELAEERLLVLRLRARREKALPAAALVSARHMWVANFGPSRVQEPSLGVRARLLQQNHDRRRHVLRTGARWLAQRRRKVAAEAERAPSETAGAISGAGPHAPMVGLQGETR